MTISEPGWQSDHPPVDPQLPELVTAHDVAARHDLTGKRAIVTGAGSGIGTATAQALAVAGAQVVLAVRSVEGAAPVVDAINEAAGAQRASASQLDLADLASIRAFAEREGAAPLHLLIANAGVMATPEGRTGDGFETQFGTNHIGHFLLTSLLTPALVSGAPARVVVLASGGHALGDVDLDDPHFERRAYHPFTAYGQSKAANILFALEYDRRLRARGVRAFSVNPGAVTTALGRHVQPEHAIEQGWDKPLPVRMQTPEQGAATSLWAALATELDGYGGLYLEECREAAIATERQPYRDVQRYAIDPEAAAALWDYSVRVTDAPSV